MDLEDVASLEKKRRREELVVEMVMRIGALNLLIGKEEEGMAGYKTQCGGDGGCMME